jgi:cation diffusion facilitator CzcD-associated flavoprotein CzcO
MHTATWDEDYDLKDKDVAIIGSGSSAAQVVPSIQPIVKKLYSFNRSATWITAGFAQRFAGPDGGNFYYTEKQKKLLAEDPQLYLEYRKMIESEISERFRFILRNSPEAVQAREFSIAEMMRKLKGDTRLVDTIIPKNFAIGCRRPTPGEGFLEALIAPNTTVYTDTIKRVTETGFVGPDDIAHDVDVIICATGFDTSWLPSFPLIANGKDLRDVWKDNALSYLAVGVPNFPNYFTFAGPVSPLCLSFCFLLINCSMVLWRLALFSL